MTQRLAVVIPAYKARYLDAALASLAQQTCTGFTVHVGDDASPEPIAAICARWQHVLDLRYRRFEANLGGSDLVAQWRRCVALTAEPWVWLFADDDLMPPDAVARLMQAIDDDGDSTDLYHFDVEWINAQGRVCRMDPRFPPRLSARDFALARLRLRLSSFASEYVFARHAYERCGGFVSLGRGWCADDASWMRLAQRRGMRTLPGRRLGWRHSGHNISSAHHRDAATKLQAQHDFVQWLQAFLREHPAAAGEPADAEILRWTGPWLQRQRHHLGAAAAAAAPAIDAATMDTLRLALGRIPDRIASRCRTLLRHAGQHP